MQSDPAFSVTAGLAELHAVLDRVAVADPEVWELGSALAEVARAEARLASVKLRLVAAAESAAVAAGDGSTDTAAWAAHAVGGTRSRRWGAVWLARQLAETYRCTAAALGQGRIGEEHAAIIVAAADRVPDGITPGELARCEEALVA